MGEGMTTQVDGVGDKGGKAFVHLTFPSDPAGTCHYRIKPTSNRRIFFYQDKKG